MHRLIFTISLLMALTTSAPGIHGAELAVTPSDVYGQADFIIREIELLKAHFNISDTGKVRRIRVEFKPRHVWQKSYEILIKINILREKLGYPVIEVNSLEPVMNITPVLVFEQARRIQTELGLLKMRLGIVGGPDGYEGFSGKSSSDVYQLLNTISLGLDGINGTGFTPSHVFAQVMRVHWDVVTLLDALEINDVSTPPSRRENTAPVDVFTLSMQFLKEVGRLQTSGGIPKTDFSDLWSDRITPTEVFGAMEIIVAELQTLKANLGLKHAMTPPAAFYEGKTPTDVYQILGWTLRKLKLIKSL